MKAIIFATIGVLALGGAAVAAESARLSDLLSISPSALAIDPCTLRGRGISIADGVCLKVSGGVSYYQTWGNSTGGAGAASGGQFIVQTPDDDFTIPAPR